MKLLIMRCPERDVALIVAGFTLTFAQLGYSAGAGEPWLVPEPAEVESLPATEAAFPVAFAASYPVDKPAWYFHAEALALKRSDASERPFAVLTKRVWTKTENPTREEGEPEYIWMPTDNSTTVLSTQDLHFPFDLGLRIQIGRTLGDWHSFDVCYFGLTDWNENAAVADTTEFITEVNEDGQATAGFPASLFSPFSDFGDARLSGDPDGAVFDHNIFAYISYSSSLHNIECNLRRWIIQAPGALQMSTLIGGRYMNVDETFHYLTVGSGETSVLTGTANRMIGVQIGAAYELSLCPVWCVECEVKGAIFNNNASQNTFFEHTGEDIYQGTHVGRSERDIAAFAVDVRLTNTLLVTPHLAIRASYQFLYVDGLALASENLNQNVNLLRIGGASPVGGQVAYHGLQLGVSWVW